MTAPTASVFGVPEGFTFVSDRSVETAQALLAAADELGVEQRGIKTTSSGYLVPNNIAEQYESTLAATAGKSETPDDTWTVKELKAYAEAHDVDLGDASKKADVLAALDAAGNKEE